MVLLDSSLKAAAFDRAAAVIFSDPHQRPGHTGLPSCLPKELLDALQRWKQSEAPSLKIRFRIHEREYTCYASLIEPQDSWLPQAIIALSLKRGASAWDALTEASSEYHLTGREQEALKGIAVGLTSKELAERMNISPNTVKAFLRLIMAKMSVSTRAGIVAKLLEHKDGEITS